MRKKFKECMRVAFPNIDSEEVNDNILRGMIGTFVAGWLSALEDGQDHVMLAKWRMWLVKEGVVLPGWVPDDSWKWWK